MPPADTRILQRVLDRIEIEDCLARYARGVDRRDWPLVRSTYHEDARDDHGDYKGDINGFIDWVSQRHALIRQSMHFLGNILIEFADDHRAVAETCWVALQRLGPEAGEAHARHLGPGDPPDSVVDMEILGRYVDHFQRRQGPWKVSRRTVVFEAIKRRIGAELPIGANWVAQSRDRSDPIYAARSTYGLR